MLLHPRKNKLAKAAGQLGAALHMASAIALCGLLCVFLGACSSGSSSSQTQNASDASGMAADGGEISVSDKAQAAGPWDDVLRHYAANAQVNQLLLVQQTEQSVATASFYTKNAARTQNDPTAWTLVFEENARIGTDGVGQASETSSVTPEGDFGVTLAFGIGENPGTVLNYIHVTPTTYACSDDCAYYNQIIDVNEVLHSCSGEAMYNSTRAYQYGFAIDYNSECIYGKGSNFFIHCNGNHTTTEGCVTFSQENIVAILQAATPGMRVIIRAC